MTLVATVRDVLSFVLYITFHLHVFQYITPIIPLLSQKPPYHGLPCEPSPFFLSIQGIRFSIREAGFLLRLHRLLFHMSRRRANSWQRFLSGRRTFEVLRYVGRSFLRVTVNNPRINRRGNQGGNREDNHNDDAVPSTPHTCTVDANARQDDDDYDPTVPRHADVHGHDARSHRGEVRDDEVEHLRSLEFYRRVRILADETHSWNSALTLYQQETRPLLLGHYRTAHFVQDLADGEHDNYYSDLRSYVGLTSEETVLATLVARADPHSPPRIALTVPPIYEPSDVPPYTATISPPMYSTQVPVEHIAQDVPLCTERECPVQELGIEHSRGLYHHDGQIGPVTYP